MIFGSVCSGIEAASVAWHSLGWQAAFFSEIEPFPCAVLAHHYPAVPNLGDMTKFKEWPDAKISVLVGGTPCQSFSVAGLRAGLADPRGSLMLTFLAIADRYRPEWLVWENVPGVLSSGEGRDFGALLGGLAELGYGFAYRVLDAQHFGVPQRRRRVFVVANLRDWRRAAAVLFERESLRGDSPPGREAREGVAPTISARTKGGGGLGTDFDCDGGFVTHSLRGEGFDASEDGTGRGTPLIAGAVTQRIDRGGVNSEGNDNHLIHCPPVVPQAMSSKWAKGSSGPAGDEVANLVAFSCKDSGADADALAPTMRAMGHATSHQNDGGQIAIAMRTDVTPKFGTTAFTLTQPSPTGGGQPQAVMDGRSQVRRLTPRECERLQGFPDDYTLVDYRGKTAADGPRYKALGNSMAVPVMRWIGERIQMVQDLVDNPER